PAGSWTPPSSVTFSLTTIFPIPGSPFAGVLSYHRGPATAPTGSALEEQPQVPGMAGSSVQGIVPRRLAAISLRSAGSQTRTVSAWASATSAVIAAGLGATT